MVVIPSLWFPETVTNEKSLKWLLNHDSTKNWEIVEYLVFRKCHIKSLIRKFRFSGTVKSIWFKIDVLQEELECVHYPYVSTKKKSNKHHEKRSPQVRKSIMIKIESMDQGLWYVVYRSNEVKFSQILPRSQHFSSKSFMLTHGWINIMIFIEFHMIHFCSGFFHPPDPAKGIL